MNSIMGMTDLALAENLTPIVQEYLRTARDSADVLLELLDQILDISRIEAGRLELESAPFSLHKLVEQTVKAMGVRAYQKDLELVCDLADDLPDQVVGDALRLRQVLVNLIGNAIKFTHQGEVEVRVAVGASELGLGTSDLGLRTSDPAAAHEAPKPKTQDPIPNPQALPSPSTSPSATPASAFRRRTSGRSSNRSPRPMPPRPASSAARAWG
jgi:hypothetical protein